MSGRPIGIYAPYHASHLYTKSDVLGLCDNSTTKEVYDSEVLNKEQPAVLSTNSGTTISATSRRDLLKAVLEDILASPIEWGNIIKGAITSIHSMGHAKWESQCFGPSHSQRSLVAAISAGMGVEVSVADTKVQSSSCGKRINSPIAIVGMAGRFPDADSVDELWKLLSNGIDCHKVVSMTPFF